MGVRAVEALPQSTEAPVVLAAVYLAAGMPRSARGVLERALARNPDNAEARDLLSGIEESISSAS